MNAWLLAASGLSAFTWAVHTFVGGPEVVPPLLSSSVPWVPRMTHFYCWHLVTITLAAMAAGFGYAAFVPGGLDVGWSVFGLAVAFAAWSLALNGWKRPRPWWALPQWMLFVAVAGVALPGLAWPG